MGLYDNYRLSNSQQVKQYQGSVVPELVNVSQEMQKRYDTSQNNNDYTGQFLDSIDTPFAQDRPELERMKGKFRDSLTKLSARPDLENAVRETTMLARQLPQEYEPFAASAKAFQERKDELDKATQKKPDDAGYLTPEDAKKLLEEDVYNYKGLQRSGTDNKLKGVFSGGQYTRSLDMNKVVDAALEHAKPVVNGVKYDRVNGEWINSITNKATVLKPEVVQSIINEAIQNNPEVGAYLDQQKRLATYNLNYDRLNPDAIVDSRAVVNGKKTDYVPVTLKEAIQQRVANGEEFHSVMKDVIGGRVIKGILQNAHAYGVNKYAQNDIEAGNELKENGNYWKQREADQAESNRFLIPGADIQLEEKDKDLDTLNSSIKELGDAIEVKKASLNSALPKDEQDRIQNEIQVLEDRKLAKETVSKSAGDAVAFRISKGQYKTEEELLEATKGKNAEQVYPEPKKGGMWLGKKIANVQTGESYMGGTSYKLTFEDGTTGSTVVKGTPGGMVQSQTDKNIRNEFYNAKKNEIKTNASSYAFKPMQVDLSDKEATKLKQDVLGSRASFKWFKTGDLSAPIKDDDIANIKDFELTSMQVVHKNGSYYLQGYEKSTDAKTKGEAGQNYTLQITPGSTVGKTVASNILKESKRPSDDMLRTAAVLSGSMRFSGDIASLQKGEPLTVRDNSGKIFAQLKRETYLNTEGSRYILYGSDNKPIPGFNTERLDEADKWLSDAIYMHLKK